MTTPVLCRFLPASASTVIERHWIRVAAVPVGSAVAHSASGCPAAWWALGGNRSDSGYSPGGLFSWPGS